MNFKKTFLRFTLPVIALILAVISPCFAQVTYTAKNTATANGNVGTVPVTDVSNNGPVVNRLSGDQTPVNFPMIGISETATAPSLKADGSYNIVYKFLVQNYGAIDLKNVGVINNLTTVFTSPLTYTIVSLTTTGTLAKNTGFDGNADISLLTTGTSSLTAGSSGTITLTVNVITNAHYGTFNSTSTTSAITNNADAVAVTDVSTNNASPNHANAAKTPLDFTDLTPVTLNPSDIQIVKTADNLTPNAGDNVTFTIKAQNLGPGSAAPVVVNDVINTTGFTLVSATPSKGTYDSGTGIWTIGTLAVGAGNAATLTVVATVLPDKPAATYVNTATSNHPGDPVSTNNNSTVTLTPQPVADLRITNSDNKTFYVPGTNNTYTVTATNAGPSNAAGSTITYTLPAGVTGTWTAAYFGGATGNSSGSNNINEIVNMPAGSAVIYTVDVTIPSSQPGTFITTATIATPTGINDLVPGNNIANDNDTRLGDADLGITNTDGRSNYTPGTGNTYTIVATNNGISDVSNANITLPLPSGLTGTWTAVYAGGATGNASGTNSISELVNMPVGSKITYTLLATISSAQSGTLNITATITTPSGVIDPNSVNNTALDADIQNSITNLSITNTDTRLIYVPGIASTYTVVAANTGPSDAVGSTVTYTFPAGLTGNWTAAYTGGATGNNIGVNNINELVNIPAGGTVTYTIVMPVPSSQTDPQLTTTATIAAAAGLTDSTPGDNTASDTDTRTGGADLAITITDGQTTYIPGISNTYTVVATNNGPSDISNANISFPLPSGAVANWTAVFTTGATGNAIGTNSINELVNMPAGSTITYTLTVAIPSRYTGNAVATTTISLPSGAVDPTPANNTATDIDTQNNQADLKITNTDSKTSYTPGTTNTYTIIATNNGPSDAPGSIITYTIPAGVSGTWTAVYTGGATGNASGTNNINEIVNMPANGTVTYTLIASIPSSQAGIFTTTAVIAAATGVTDVTTTNNTANDNDIKIGDADLSITNSDNRPIYVPGTNSTYTVVASNTGPSDINNVTVTYTLPAGITSTWTAVYNGGATGNASGTNNINEAVNMPSGGTVTYTIVVPVPGAQTSDFITTASIASPVGVTDPITDNNTAIDTDLRLGDADLSITNTDNKTAYTPGLGNTYTIVAANAGPSNVTGATIAYPLPAGVTGTWTAVYTGGATGNTGGANSISESVNMPVGSTITYTLLANILSNQNGSLTTTATISVPAGSVDQAPGNNSASDIDTLNSVSNLSITNTDGKVIFIPGTTNTYTVVAGNTGPSDAPGSTVTYTLPPGITGTWTATYAGGATGNASGTGSINELVNIPVGSVVTYTVVVPVPSSQTGIQFITTAMVTPAAGITDNTPANNTADDADIRVGGADLAIINTDGQTTYTPGTTNTYTIVASNNGPSDVVNANISFPVPPAALATWTAVFTGGATGNATGISSINETVSMPAGSTITYTIVGIIQPNRTGTVTTTATISLPSGSVDPTPTNNSASDTDNQNSQADLSITNTDAKASYTPGTTNTYTIVAANNGPSDALGSTVTYALPVGVTGTWTAIYSGGATGNTSGTNGINETVNMPTGSTITYTLIASVPSNQTGTFITIASIATVAGINDPTPANNTARDIDLRNSDVDLSITNTDNKTNYTPGLTNTYTVIVANAGPSDAPGSTVSYTLPAGATATWTAVYAGGAAGNANGINAINETVSMPAGSTITYTITVGVPSNTINPFITTATITTAPTITDALPGNNTSADVDLQNSQSELSITNTDGKIIYTPGTTNTYTIVATNTGPSDAPGSRVTVNTSAAGLTASWTAVYTGGASGNAGGTGSINELVNIPVGGTVTYTGIVSIPSSQAGAITTVASIAAAAGITDTNQVNNTTADNDVPLGSFDLSITNTDNQANYTPGTTSTYTVAAVNIGPSDVTGATITDPVPAGVTQSWVASFKGGATGTASGTGSINEQVNMPAGSTITYAVTVNSPGSRVGTLTTVATIAAPISLTDPLPANNTATDVDTQNSRADLGITSTDGKIAYTPGVVNTYTIVATNYGPSDAPGSKIMTATTATGITATWTAVYTGGATGNASGTGAINETVNMPAGSIVIYTLLATVPSSQKGPFNTTSTVTTAISITDQVSSNNTAIDNDVPLGSFDLSITNTDNQLNYTPGTTSTYTVTALNSGPSDVIGATITYPVPTGTTQTWVATFAGGANGTASGTGAINQTVNMPAGSMITYTVTLSIPGSRASTVTTIATIAAPISLTDPLPANNTSADVDLQNSQSELSITNTDGKIIYTPGTTNTYTIVATNTGPSDAPGSRVTVNTSAAGLTASWTAVYTGGASGNAGGTGSINELVNIPVGGTVTYTGIVSIPSSQAGAITTVASIAAAAGITDTNQANNTTADNDVPLGSFDLSITNTDGQTSYTPGTTSTYTVAALNIGPSDVTGATITYPVPAGTTQTWVATFTGGATGTASSTGSINEQVNMPAGSTITYAVTVSSPGSRVGTLTTVATIAAPISLTDPLPANNTATDVDIQNSRADLSITNTDNKIIYTPGTTNTYTIVATNTGSSDAPGSRVTVNTLATGLTASWTAVYTGGATGNASGTGGINELVNIPVNGKVTYTVIATIPGGQTGTITTTATIIPATGITDPVMANNTAVDNDTQNSIIDLKIVKTASVTGQYVNSQVTFTLAVTNNGPSVATNVTVNDLLPAGFTYVSSAPSIGTYNNTTGIWAIGSMPNAGTANITIVALVNATGSATNIATVTGTETDSDPTNNTSQVTITVQQLPLAKNDAATTNPNVPIPINVLTNDVKGFANLDPASVVIVTQPAHGTVTVANTGVVNYSPALNYFGADQFTYTVKDVNGQVSNVATVSITINDFPVIGLAKAVTSSVSIINGSYDVTYVLTVGNYGVAPLNNISITDNLAQTFNGENILLKSITSLGKLTVNTVYTGSGTIEMLQAGNTLAVGQVEQLQIVVNVGLVTGTTKFFNTATAKGTSVTGLMATDQSTDGLKPDPITSGNVSPSDPTPVELPKLLVRIPGGFSPNGDGTHDKWVIENTGSSIVNVEIYNRWGNLVFKDANYKNTWGGECNQGLHIGENLPSGTYYYIVVIDGKNKYVNYLTLNR